MKSSFLSALLICLLSCLLDNAIAIEGKSKDYRVGDRLAQHPVSGQSVYREVTWDALMPENWRPMIDFKRLDFSKLIDSDPRATEALLKLREAWSNAPVAPNMNGVRIRIPGFIVPLEEAHNQISEFLLVPYFGGCIHVPPPPTNQIIHVYPAKPLKGMHTMDAIWISGVLEVHTSDTEMGSASYQMRAEIIEPYSSNKP